jgi:hypothetical protein
MISSRFFLIFAAVLGVCQSSTSFRVGTRLAPPRISSENTVVPKQSSKAFTVKQGSVSRYASVPSEEPAEIEGGGKTLVQRIGKYFSFKSDGMTTGQRLAKIGVDVFLSYGFVQNLSMTISTSLAWYIFSSRVSATWL